LIIGKEKKKDGKFYLLSDMLIYLPKDNKVKYIIWLKDALVQSGMSIIEMTYGENKSEKVVFSIDNESARQTFLTKLNERLEVYQAMREMMSQ